MNTILNKWGGVVAGTLLIGLIAVSAVAGENQPKGLATISADTEVPVPPQPPEPPEPPQQPFFVKSSRTPAEATWLGVGAEETSESLTSQLELKPGEGLVVTFVSSNSPAAIAGLRKNDVL
ncbi:MAG TPA: hypothetical protein VH251_00330, partial [Verrucomicrobiae bacterium]|nr:hypothetical protein [Verrucomicrobiae bacterium]